MDAPNIKKRGKIYGIKIKILEKKGTVGICRVFRGSYKMSSGGGLSGTVGGDKKSTISKKIEYWGNIDCLALLH